MTSKMVIQSQTIQKKANGRPAKSVPRGVKKTNREKSDGPRPFGRMVLSRRRKEEERKELSVIAAFQCGIDAHKSNRFFD